MRADLRSEIGDYQGAIEDISFLINKDQEASRYMERGIAKYNMGDSEGAFSDLNKAIELGSDEASKVLNEIQQKQSH